MLNLDDKYPSARINPLAKLIVNEQKQKSSVPELYKKRPVLSFAKTEFKAVNIAKGRAFLARLFAL